MFSDCVICLLCAYPHSLFMFVCCVCVCFFIICLLMFPLSRRGSLPPTVQNHASWGDLVSLNGPEVYVLVWIVVYVCLSHGPVINWRFVHGAAPPSPNDSWKRLQPTPLGVWKMAGWTCFFICRDTHKILNCFPAVIQPTPKIYTVKVPTQRNWRFF